MANKDVTVICTAADRENANAKAAEFGDGPNSFSVPLSTQPGIKDPALSTHWGGSGQVSAEMADAMDVSLDPMVKVFDNTDGTSFADHLTMCTPPLYRIYEEL